MRSESGDKFSSHGFSDIEKSVLCKGLTFSVKPKSVEYSNFLLPFELFFWDVKEENLCREDLSLMKARLLDTALSSHKSFSIDQSPSENLAHLNLTQLKTNLTENVWIQILKAFVIWKWMQRHKLISSCWRNW